MALHPFPRRFLVLIASTFLCYQFSNVASKTSSKHLCPAQCDPQTCEIKILSCDNMFELPRHLPDSIEKVLVINKYPRHKTMLSAYNFTHYLPPLHNLTKLTLQNMSIHDIKSRTFQFLTKLETLDLSHNDLRLIKPNAFAGLRLSMLRLRNNPRISFNSGSFSNLQVRNLYIDNCQLKTLPYNVIRPIADHLDQLVLSYNQLRVLDMEFSGLFQRLTAFSLLKNQFNCSKCRNKWLINTMKEVYRRAKAKDTIHPKCEFPLELRGRYMYTLSKDDLVCPQPSVQRISVLLMHNNRARLTCTASHKKSSVSWVNTPTGNLLSESSYSNTFVVIQTQKVDSFSCLVKVEGGPNISSTRLQISWPPPSLPIPSPIHPPSLNRSAPSTPPHNDSYFFQPQFSLIEMIAGVVGTFLGTLLIFITMLRLLFYRIKVFSSKHHQFTEQIEQCHTNVLYQPTYHGYSPSNNPTSKFNPLSYKQLNTGHNNNNTTHLDSHTDKRKRYVSYEPPTYSDNSQTYDIPNHLIAPSPPPPPLSSSPSSNPIIIPSSSLSANNFGCIPVSTNTQQLPTTTATMNNRSGHFIDFKTQKAV